MVVCVGSGGNIIGQRDLKKRKRKTEKQKCRNGEKERKRTKNMGTSVRKMTGGKACKEV